MKNHYVAALCTLSYAAGLAIGVFVSMDVDKKTETKPKKQDDKKFLAARNRAYENIRIRANVGDLVRASDDVIHEAFKNELNFQLVVENSM